MVSNFGAPIAPEDLKALQSLTASGVIDELVEYMPRTFTADEKRHLVAPNATPSDMWGASPEAIGDHFCNELSKREIGRRRCLAGECHVFMSIDADEFYARGQLAEAIRAMWQGGHDAVTCRMRHFMVDPTWELRPHDDTNRVAAVMRCHTHMPFRLCVPTSMLIDPTRRLLRASRILDLPRARLEMHHMSLVRRNLKSKFSSVSNRANYPQGAAAAARSLEAWAPDKGPVAHPHPASRAWFNTVVVVPNYFGVHIPGSRPALPVGSRYSGGEFVGSEPADEAEGIRAALCLPASWLTSRSVPGEPSGSDGIGLRALEHERGAAARVAE